MATWTINRGFINGDRVDGAFSGSTITDASYVWMAASNGSSTHYTDKVSLTSKFNSASNGTGSELCYTTNSAALSFGMNVTSTTYKLNRLYFGDFSGNVFGGFALVSGIDQTNGATIDIASGDMRLAFAYDSSWTSTVKDQFAQGWGKRYMNYLTGNGNLPAMSNVKQVYFSDWPGVAGSSNMSGANFRRDAQFNTSGRDTMTNSTQNTTGSSFTIKYTGYYDGGTGETVFYMQCNGTGSSGSTPCIIADDGAVSYTQSTEYNYCVGG